ncbi:MAG: ROK family protein [Pseudomonadota bacterium]
MSAAKAVGTDVGDIKRWETSSFASSKELLDAVLPDAVIDDLRIAAAGPLVGEKITMTNADLEFSKSEISNNYNTQNTTLVNDLVAAAWSVYGDDFPAFDRSLVINVGSGFGGALVLGRPSYRVLGFEPGRISTTALTEIGQRLFSAGADYEIRELEDVLGGLGLQRMYSALCGNSVPGLSSKTVFKHYRAGNDKAALAIELFKSVLADACAELSLLFAPAEKIWLTGGVVKFNYSDVVDTLFFEKYQKRKYKELRSEKPRIALIPFDEPEIVGLTKILE